MQQNVYVPSARPPRPLCEKGRHRATAQCNTENATRSICRDCGCPIKKISVTGRWIYTGLLY